MDLCVTSVVRSTMYVPASARNRKTLPLLALSSLLSLLLLALTLTTTKPQQLQTHHLHYHKHIQLPQSTCHGTLYPQLCLSTLASFPNLTSKSLPQLISSLLNHTLHEVTSSSYNCTAIRTTLTHLNTFQHRALDDCLKLFDHTVDYLNTTIAQLSQPPITSKSHHHLHTLLSAAMTNIYTCLDGFGDSDTKTSTPKIRHIIEKRLFQICYHVSNSLAMLKKVASRNKLGAHAHHSHDDHKHAFPSWLSSKDRKLLQASVNETKFDAVVAKDGTGNFTTIGEALAAAPNDTNTRKKTNVMLVGDGIGKTIVKASRNVVDGWTTFQSATVAVEGDRFIGKGITFENSAGPSKHQAVALRSDSDYSVFYKCSFVGYQDTLYVHSLRQFYRECDIYGTVDFIFGNAAVVFQKCNLYARKPDPNQRNLFTAQGREDPNQNTGISILNSKIAAASDLVPLKSSFKSYLGRPWKQYSRTVYLECYMEDLIDPAGWLEWNGSFALNTLYYAEYNNKGPGSNTSARVKWSGYKLINSSTEASQFTVAQFIQGYDWLNTTGVPFFPNLTP
ncbi:pectinesterase-like [Senna tora]|uniref:Pectinesterase n=1 Tax=Senna tora TaxID=362788 RepID=A0A834W3Y9_9FABA|nr:pectinesterase-like [Senna tora]